MREALEREAVWKASGYGIGESRCVVKNNPSLELKVLDSSAYYDGQIKVQQIKIDDQR